MSRSIFDVSSLPTAPATEAARALQNVVPNIAVADVQAASLSEIYETYKKLFIDNTDTSYVGMRQGALKRLGMIFRSSSSEWSTVEAMKQKIEFYSRRIRTDKSREEFIPDPDPPDPEIKKDMTIDQVCREGYMALRFYVKSITDYMEALDTCIVEAQAALTELKALNDNPALGDYEKSQQAISIIDRLAITERYAEEIVKTLTKYNYYNNDTKQWEIAYDRTQMKYEGEDTYEEEEASKYDQTSKVSRYKDYKANGGLSAIRNTKVDYKDTATGENEAVIQVFSSLSMIDRAKFIYYYYMLIMRGGDTNYTNFPDNKETGYPCIPDVKSTNDTEATKHLGALEMFYVGYLTDRDGPINAVSSFFEIKVQALRENLTIQSKSISALNTYLEFINRGLNVLNGSQSGADGKENTHAIPNGCMIALTYLCGGNMYNLAEASDGTKCLVLESNYGGCPGYLLVSADNAGMNFLIGDDASVSYARDNDGNSHSSVSASGMVRLWISVQHRPCITMRTERCPTKDIITKQKRSVAF